MKHEHKTRRPAAGPPTADNLAIKILTHAQSALLLQLRFLSVALYKLTLTPSWQGQNGDMPADVAGAADATLPALATDGRRLYFDGVGVVRLYKAEGRTIPRRFLHVVMHCIFNHPFVGEGMDTRAWDLACDIAVEMAIDELGLSMLRISPPPDQSPAVQLLRQAGVAPTAERIYLYLRGRPADETEKWYAHSQDFHVDDHSKWYPASAQKPPEEDENHSQANADDTEDGSGNISEGDDEDSRSGDGNGNGDKSVASRSARMPASSPVQSTAAAEWRELAAGIREELETFAKAQGDAAGSLTQNLLAVTRERHDYGAFLRRFAALSEEMQVNDDEFDYIFYTYGLKLYDNLPLIEPLEYRDVLRVREFVIAIDTSGSVQGEAVQAFIQKTYNILKQSESFASRVRIHIIQCDAAIQEVATIDHLDELDDYIRTLTIKGFGGTDFRPVFSYVDAQIAAGVFTDLRGLLYFTDGMGTFPGYMPAYQTAFVFLENDAAYTHNAPVWAIKIVLEPGGLAYV